MENIKATYACSPRLRLGALDGARSAGDAGTRTAYGRSALMGGAIVLAPRPVSVEGTGLSIAMRDNTAIAATASITLPISNIVVFGDNAGIRTWSPPV